MGLCQFTAQFSKPLFSASFEHDQGHEDGQSVLPSENSLSVSQEGLGDQRGTRGLQPREAWRILTGHGLISGPGLIAPFQASHWVLDASGTLCCFSPPNLSPPAWLLLLIFANSSNASPGPGQSLPVAWVSPGCDLNFSGALSHPPAVRGWRCGNSEAPSR